MTEELQISDDVDASESNCGQRYSIPSATQVATQYHTTAMIQVYEHN